MRTRREPGPPGKLLGWIAAALVVGWLVFIAHRLDSSVKKHGREHTRRDAGRTLVGADARE